MASQSVRDVSEQLTPSVRDVSESKCQGSLYLVPLAIGKRLTVNLPENVRDGFYKTRQRELQRLIKQAEDSTRAKVLSVMTDTKGTAFFTELPVGTYVVSNLLPTESSSTSILWNCEIEVKPGDLAHEKPFLISNVRDRTVKCVGKEKPLPVCEPTRNSGQ